MSTLITNRVNFYDAIFERQIMPDCILKIGYKDTGILLYSDDDNLSKGIEQENFSIQIIPEYLDIGYQDHLTKKVINEYRLGYASKLNDFKDVNSYLRSQYGKNAKPILKNVKRLEMCFDVNYVFYHGEIKKSQYDFLMEALRNMLTKRFKQRNDANFRLNEWQELLQRTYKLIELKKASLFVIYNNDEPIQINVQYHVKDILIGSIASYNIDYQVFGLGNTGVYKQIEWCISNNYFIYDQGHGDLEYKRRWSNLIYNFKHHVVYSKSDLKSKFKANIEVLKVSTKAFLRKKKAVETLKTIKSKFSRESQDKTPFVKSFEIIELATITDEINTFTSINWKASEYQFLVKNICDFLYYKFEHFNNIVVLQHNSESDIFIIKGKNAYQKVVFH
ncbi:GNAT family N-acetyltransferase [Algibacter amylolyticus]|uniref:GNAT family N-acetyltransferase n=1 Tax=Algibacter amylolyticus TaxID=1608400 RepID=A0A5M7BBN2_9FLAO|nr:GNAT family N-acetyltransferase [Algibacter amylolyticus]KAA5825637.1 GNAT family N-acetyltransferase [Algibacter amylolyticus]MBB5268134.1 Txe/YoeB family toxin of Txe-Axe toxin-antitoxin module [Algibacter amylolyticus]TSJ79935.1 GNAT family N-acetyltransferase [Algibacter amylolyticus]